MGFAALIPVLLPYLSKLIDRVIPDEQAKAAAKLELLKTLAESDQKEWDAKSKVIIAEAQGESAAQRNWRPHLMYLFMILLSMNYIVIPTLAAFGVHIDSYALPPQMWSLLEIGVGGYIVGRSGEKIVHKFNDTAFFDKLRTKFHGLTQAQVDAFNEALKEGKHAD